MESPEESTLMDPAELKAQPAVSKHEFTSSNVKEEDGSSSCDATVGTEEEEEEDTGARAMGEAPDRCSDGSDSGLGPDDEGRTTNESDPANAGSSTVGNDAPLPRSPLPPTAMPSRSTLKRPHADQHQEELGEPSAKKKRGITFDSVTVFYFARAQGFTCVPSQGGSTLGMAPQHSHVQNFTLAEHALEQRRHHRQILLQLRNQRLQNAEVGSCTLTSQPISSSSEDSESDEETSELSDSELDPDNYYCLQPVPTRQRRVMLRAAGVHKIDSVEKDECRDIRSSREFCGCACKGYCDPDTCSCARAGIKCQVDRLSFPCGCTRDGCANGAGRIEFNLERVRTHFIQTLMRLEMEKKQSAEQERQKQLAQWNSNNRGELPSASGLLVKQHDGKPGPHHVNLSPNIESCVHSGNFTTLHYADPQQQSVSRGEALDLYSFREEESFSPHESNPNQKNEKLTSIHQQYCNFASAFNSHSNGFLSSNQTFVQHSFDTAYRFQDHTDALSNGYQQHQVFANTFTNTNFGTLHYEYQNFVVGASNKTDSVLTDIDFSCDPSHVITYPDNQLSSVLFPRQEETTHLKEEDSVSSNSSSAPSKYTSLHPVVNGNSTKLEPFSELLGAQYSSSSSSSFATASPAMFPPTASFVGCENLLQEQGHPQTLAAQNQGSPSLLDECADNFGEIIKKSMVETVSA
ncbi:hypothetical protein B566_EDAN005469 [Ephemera danica]|nr:hypothetical protein B566_EDAN005469 [Ephemera danica]